MGVLHHSTCRGRELLSRPCRADPAGRGLMSVEVLRRKTFNVLDEADSFGPHDDLPVMPARIHPQLLVSRSDRTQPFFLVGSFDMMLTGMRGKGWVEFRNSSVLRHPLEVGDFITIPARTPHRVVPDDEIVV